MTLCLSEIPQNQKVQTKAAKRNACVQNICLPNLPYVTRNTIYNAMSCTSKCMHGMNQTEAEYWQEIPKSKFEPNRASSIGGITRYILRMRTIGHVT